MSAEKRVSELEPADIGKVVDIRDRRESAFGVLTSVGDRGNGYITVGLGGPVSSFRPDATVAVYGVSA